MSKREVLNSTDSVLNEIFSVVFAVLMRKINVL